MSDKKVDSSSSGHRRRLREKFLNSGLAGFHDYEIVELLLTLGTPRSDCKPVAKDLMRKFRSLNVILDAPIEELIETKGVGPSNVFGLKLIQAVSEVYQERELEDSFKLDSPESIYNYLKEKIGKKSKEHFVILFFNTQSKLIADDISIGTLNASLVHPREVFEKAIRNNASHVIVAHNHPSGDHTPSQTDKDTTKRLVEAGKILGITLVDHMVVSKNGYVSLRDEMKNIFT